jgi:hypothetical protein
VRVTAGALARRRREAATIGTGSHVKHQMEIYDRSEDMKDKKIRLSDHGVRT